MNFLGVSHLYLSSILTSFVKIFYKMLLHAINKNKHSNQQTTENKKKTGTWPDQNLCRYLRLISFLTIFSGTTNDLSVPSLIYSFEVLQKELKKCIHYYSKVINKYNFLFFFLFIYLSIYFYFVFYKSYYSFLNSI